MTKHRLRFGFWSTAALTVVLAATLIWNQLADSSSSCDAAQSTCTGSSPVPFVEAFVLALNVLIVWGVCYWLVRFVIKVGRRTRSRPAA